MFENKKVLVIGGTGTIGQVLVKRILQDNPEVIRIFSRDEYKQFIMREELRDIDNIRFLIGDVRDRKRVYRAMQEIDIVFNLAALKHVPSCEYNPFEAVQTNIIGTQNVIECAMANGVKKMIYTSSDKAVSPTNTMGATKLLAERLMSASYYSRGGADTVFSSVRFGNVMGSRGSVIPLFKEQILKNREITLTEPEMTRYMMTPGQAVELMIKAADVSKGGEVFVLKMPVIKLIDLADVIIKKVCERENIDANTVKIKKIGLRPGEKNYEELMSEDELSKAVELDDMYVINPVYGNENGIAGTAVEDIGYSSMAWNALTKEEIEELLIKENLI